MRAIPESLRPKYPDTRLGVLKYLREASSHDLRASNIRSIRPDPQVDGVWEVMLPNYQIIVYLAGYREPSGRIRRFDDFEDCELTDG